MLVSNFAFTSFYTFSYQYAPLLWTIPVMVPLIHLSHTMGVYTTLAVAVERAATFIPWISKVGILKL